MNSLTLSFFFSTTLWLWSDGHCQSVLEVAQESSAQDRVIRSKHTLYLWSALSPEEAVLRLGSHCHGGALPGCLLRLSKWSEYQSQIGPRGKFGLFQILFSLNFPSVEVARHQQPDVDMCKGLMSAPWGCCEARANDPSDHSQYFPAGCEVYTYYYI